MKQQYLSEDARPFISNFKTHVGEGKWAGSHYRFLHQREPEKQWDLLQFN